MSLVAVSRERGLVSSNDPSEAKSGPLDRNYPPPVPVRLTLLLMPGATSRVVPGPFDADEPSPGMPVEREAQPSSISKANAAAETQRRRTPVLMVRVLRSEQTLRA